MARNDFTPAQDAKVVELRDRAGLTFELIAKRLGVSRSRAQDAYARGRSAAGMPLESKGIGRPRDGVRGQQ
jgi:DNA-directed RNA polymerase specialized sigma24 family protein